MSEYGVFERALLDVFAEETAGAPVERIAANVLDSTRRIRPRPTWLATLRQPPLRLGAQHAVGVSRHQLALAAILATLLLAAAAALVGSLMDGGKGPDWLGPRGGPARTSSGFSGPVGLPVLEWRVDVGGGIRTDPVVMDATVLVVSEDGVLHALDIDNGVERWRFAPGTSLVGPSTDGETVFVVDGQGVVHALEIDAGAERWASSTLAQGANAPMVADGSVFVPAGDGSVIAFDLRTGATSWRSQIGSGAVHTLALGDGRIFAATDDGLLVALRPDDGSRLWTVDTGSDGTGTPVVANGLVYLGANSDERTARLRAVDAVTGVQRWIIDEPLFAPAVLDSLAVSTSTIGVVVARDAITGAERWRFESAGTSRGPAIGGDTVFVASDHGQAVFALDASSGGLLWSFEVDGGNQCCVAIANGYAVVGTMTGSVYALRGDGATLVPSVPSPRSSVVVPAPSTSPTAALPEALAVVRRLSAGELGLESPQALAVGSSGDIYITDLTHRVTHLDSDGALLGRWGGLGDGPGEFDFIPAQAGSNPQASIAVGPDGKVYVSDSDNHRVQVFMPDGTFVREFGSVGSGIGQFTVPFDLSVDAEGSIYVADDGLERITKLTAEGEPLWILDGSVDSALRGHAHSLDIDSAGRVVAIFDDTGTVVIIDPEGRVAETYTAPGCEVTFPSDDRHYVTGCDLGVTVYGSDRAPIARSPGLGIRAPQFGPNGQIVALDHDGSVVFLAALE